MAEDAPDHPLTDQDAPDTRAPGHRRGPPDGHPHHAHGRAGLVIGGTRLNGGLGSVIGTLMGVLIYGTLRDGDRVRRQPSPWWSRIVMGTLLLLYVLLQRRPLRRGRGE